MPDFDFIGYSPQEVDNLLVKIEPELKKLSFAKDIVFIRKHNQDVKVVQLIGGQAPFVRIYTRCQERAALLTGILKKFVDVEIVLISHFTPKETEQIV